MNGGGVAAEYTALPSRRQPTLTRQMPRPYAAVTRQEAIGMPITAPRYTVEDLDRFPDDGNRYELLDGMLLVTPARRTCTMPGSGEAVVLQLDEVFADVP